jgi:hypothetical protein
VASVDRMSAREHIVLVIDAAAFSGRDISLVTCSIRRLSCSLSFGSILQENRSKRVGEQIDFPPCLDWKPALFCSKQRAQLIGVFGYFVEQARQYCFPESEWNSIPS